MGLHRPLEDAAIKLAQDRRIGEVLALLHERSLESFGELLSGISVPTHVLYAHTLGRAERVAEQLAGSLK